MIRWPCRRPRLLPITIVALGVLLTVKSVAIVRAEVPTAMAAGAAPAAPAKASANPAVKPAATGRKAAQPDAFVPADAVISPAERALLLDLRKRRKELDDRTAALAMRESVVGAAEKRLAARADELLALQTKLEALERARRQRDDANWEQLVKVYEGMKPRDAAAIFNSLDKTVLLPVLDRMKPAKVATVLAAMQPDRARETTVELAQMRDSGTAVHAAAKGGS
jgi:flagellar motility protein MotE (MotC chaperone)